MIVTYNGVPINLNGSIINYKRPYGSLYLLGDSTSNLSLTNEVDFRMGTGDFTIEWFQYRTDNNTFPRLFQIGDYPTTSIEDPQKDQYPLSNENPDLLPVYRFPYHTSTGNGYHNEDH